MKNIIARFAKHPSIRTKIFIVFITSLSVYILLASVISRRILNESTQQQLSQGIRQSSDLLVSGIQSQLDNTKNISYSLLQNSDIQSWLEENESTRFDVARNANRVLTQTYVTFPGISSIYLFNNEGESISASYYRTIHSFEDIFETSWYQRAVELGGGFFISLNADGTLFSSQSYNHISLIRQILNLSTLLPEGFIIINLNESFISGIILDISEKYDTTFYILDENGSSVLQDQQVPSWSEDIPSAGTTRRIGKETLFLYQAEIPELGWTVLSSTPFRTPDGVNYSVQMVVIPMICAVGMYLLGSIYSANLIANPVNKLISAMQGVREGRFERLPHDGAKDEFGQLNENFNIMIGELNTLIQQRVLLEKEKQRFELDILTQQFQPHFLYNSLDSISYLVLSGSSQQAYDMIVALSSFYRACVSKGQEIVPLYQEVDMIKNYLTLQKMRYGELIKDSYDIIPEARNAPVLRNILQPLVENCIYHGIKPSGEPGLIIIRAWVVDDRLHIMVEDNGLGIKPQILANLDINPMAPNCASFGLRGTIKRMQLFYGQSDIYDISSVPGKGTSVLFKLPLEADFSAQEQVNTHI